MKYGVIGTGAIGGYYGARLAHSGQEVHFLLHSDYEHVRQHGLRVLSPQGNFHLSQPHIYKDARDMPQCDVVLVGLKTTNNHLLAQLLPPLLHSRTLVLLIQNGIGVEADVQQMFPGLWLAAGLAFICSAKTEPGVVNHQFYGSLNIGNYSCTDSKLIDQLLDELHAADIEAKSLEYEKARWRKAVWNMPYNGMTVALNCQTRDLMTQPDSRRLIYEQMLEVCNAATALGVQGVDEAFAQKMMQMTDDMVPYSPSMRLDWDFHRPMEIQYLYTRPLQMARQAGCPMPRLEMLEAELRFMEAQKTS
ncbi:MAG: putative 2-dehydropantoate 2-reductase [Bacteroidaceae bacterium]|nr:putative 2-dehydropantoate 2-reductase [Bacteroidaceae bacterium]